MSIPGISAYPNPFVLGNTSQGNRVHVMAAGETLDSVAQDYGVTSQALYDANPQIHPPVVLQTGMQLTIPEPDAGGDQGSGGIHTNFQVDGSMGGSSANASGSVSVNPDAGTTSLSGSIGFSKDVTNAKGRGVSFGVNASATRVTGKKTENGVTTYNASTDVSVSLNAGVHSKQAGVEIGHTEGIKSSFKVSMPEQAAKTTDLSGVNPFDPSSMPTGTVVKIDGSNYTTNEFKATFKNLAAQTKVTNASGTSLLVEKTGANSVRVTAGPTQAIDAYNGVGVDFGVASAMLGRADHLSGATLKTAQFDLSTTAGKAAFNDFIATGNMPADNGQGISGVKTIQKLDYSSQAKLDAKIGPFNIGLDGAKNTGNSVLVTEPDGTMTRTVNLQYSGNVPMTMSQKFDANGNEITSARTYSYTIKTNKNTAQLINAAQTGSIDNAKNGPVKPGQTVTITYTQAEMKALLGDAQKALDASHNMNFELRTLTRDYDGNPVSAYHFALGLARNIGGSDYGSAERLFEIATGADGNMVEGMVALPGSVSVVS